MELCNIICLLRPHEHITCYTSLCHLHISRGDYVLLWATRSHLSARRVTCQRWAGPRGVVTSVMFSSLPPKARLSSPRRHPGGRSALLLSCLKSDADEEFNRSPPPEKRTQYNWGNVFGCFTPLCSARL